MQKNNNKMPLTSSKVAKKAKKMGTPSPPKKKKVNEQKNADGPSKVLTTKAKGPAKKIAVVAKKGTVVKKELKVAVIKKKSTPTKIPVQSSKIIATKVIKKPTAKKVTKPKVKKVTLNTTKTELQTDTKLSEKSEETDAIIPKAKKLKKSSPDEQSNQTDSAKSTAKKPQNSKLSKKPIDLDPAVKQTLPSVVVTEVTKDTASKPATKKLTNTEKKVSAIVEKDKTVETVKVEQKSKLTPKKKVVAKVINKIVKSPQVLKKIKVKKEVVKRQTSPIKMEPVDTQIIDKIKIEEPPIKEVVEPEKKPPKKEEKSIESEKLPEKKQIKPKEISEINDKETKETIAKLLKEVNKTILKEPAKKKREMLKAKTSPNNVIIKKSKLSKPKPKKQDQTIITVKTEPAEIKDETTPKKIIKKVVKPKKKAVIKTEEETEPKKEQPKINKPEKEIEEIKEKIAEEEQNTNTDDSTTSDEITLNLLRQTPTNTSSVSEEAEQSLKKTDEVLSVKPKIKKKIKSELSSDNEKKTKPLKQIKKTAVKKIQQKKKMLLLKNKMRKITKERKRSTSTDTEQKGRKLKLYSWWTGPKRHRVASLNALAKVHCLYENESRGALYDVIKRSPAPKESNSEPELDRETAVESPVEPSTRTLRSVPGLRGVGKHWDMHDDTSSSSSCEEVSNDSSVEEPKRKLLTPPPSYKQKQRETIEKKPEEKEKKKTVRKRRNRTELIMDLKDMVVRKRMASLNASAILAASYSVEKKPFRSPKSETSESEESEELFDSETEKEYKKKCYDPDVKKEESDRKVIEVRASPNKKVAVILNQDTDVTITGVYVNSTTRSTHHEGYCSIAGMQYRISATSHTQTAATAVATETLLHTAGEHGPTEQPCKSYTPLGALSNMQPPGSHAHTHPHPHPHGVHVPPPSVSPSGRRHGCTSAFAAPPASQYGPPPHHHHHGPHPPPPPPQAHVGETQQPPTYIHGYYQPAGPLITAHHGHSHPPPAPTGKSAPLPTLEASPSPTPPPTTHQPPPSSTGTAESSDNEVIITSTSSGSAEQVPVALPPPAQTYRYSTSQYPPAPGGTHAAPPGYSYSYPPSQYYHSAPSGFAQQQHYHHDICYPSSAYPPSYLHPKAYATTFRRYLPPPPPAGPQYYAGNPELYSAPPSTGQSSQVVTASSGAGGSNYQPPPTGPPPPTLVESYAPPPPPVPPTIVEPYPPPHYYTTSYGSGPAPPCYSHSPTRNLAFIDPAYQSCPCPMQSCPKNVLTGPLTGDGKRSNAIAKESMPLPPVALALPLEPASVAGPPSPARGSAGMPPPPSPAGATYQPTPTGPTSVTPTKWDAKQETTETLIDCKTTTTIEKRGKARLGKTMVRNTINNNLKTPTNQGMLLMCHNQTSSQPPQTTDVVSNVKREVESPEELQVPIAAPESVESAVTQQKHERIPEIEKSSLSEEETNQSTDPKTETEVQSNITDECSKKLNLDDVNQNFITEDCKEQCVPVVQNGPIKTKSTIEEDTQIPQPKNEIKDEIDTTIKTVNNNLERTCTKRKLSIEETPEIVENDYEVDAKKQKTNPKTKVVNGSYKDLIKKANNNNKCIKINNGKRKLNIDSEIKPATTETKVMTCKTPKIMLGKNRKTTKRKNNTTTKEEPATKKLKTSKPLAERNLHSSKQNVKLKEKLPQTHSDLTENKEPVTKKTIQKKNNVNSKSNSTLNNVDRIIESVVLNSAYVEEPVRTSVKQESVLKQVIDKQNNVTELKPTDSAPKQNSVVHRITNKAAKIGCGRSGAHKRKSKDKCNPVPLPVPRIPRRSLNIPRWSNGWSWEGDSFQGKVFINSDEPLVVRKCYASMRHQEGDIISPRDCVLLKAGPRKIDLPFVAKVAALWEDEDGEMMMSLLWYYRPEHTDQGRRPIDQPDEVFASRHKDTNSVACIEDKCYVLTFNEYCRYRKNVRRLEEGMEPIDQVVPLPEGGAYYREHRQPPAPLVTSPDLVFFCRQVYDFRQKRLVKNPS